MISLRTETYNQLVKLLTVVQRFGLVYNMVYLINHHMTGLYLAAYLDYCAIHIICLNRMTCQLINYTESLMLNLPRSAT